MDDFDAIINQAKRIVGVSTTMANAAYPNGVILSCIRCGHTRRDTTHDAARYLSTGWPKHCGQTMSTKTP